MATRVFTRVHHRDNLLHRYGFWALSALIMATIAFACVTGGSQPADPDGFQGAKKGLGVAATQTSDVAVAISSEAHKITNETAAIKRVPNVEPAAAKDIGFHLNLIDVSAGAIQSESIKLTTGVVPRINTAIQETDRLNQAYKDVIARLDKEKEDRAKEKASLEKKLAEEKEKRTSAIRTMAGVVAGIAFVTMIGMILLAVFAPSPGAQKLGIGGAIAAFISLGVSVAFYEYYQFVAIGFGCLCVAVLIAGLVMLIVHLRKQKQENKELGDAKTQLVRLGEVFKQELTNLGPAGLALRKKIFGDGPIPGTAFQIMSEKTEEKIAETRNEGIVPLATKM